MTSTIGTPDRDSAIYQQAVKAFHEAWDAATQKIRQCRGLEPLGNVSGRASMPWPFPEPGTEQFEIAVYVGKREARRG
ncbi:MAG: hypothetical protein LC795_15495 [Acidobacteria bacterium]|nr:hypothetical protein [Acidobacteriota bacterium]MCA1620680.1 hypothetical protein [Acidobacteriota bacterium]